MLLWQFCQLYLSVCYVSKSQIDFLKKLSLTIATSTVACLYWSWIIWATAIATSRTSSAIAKKQNWKHNITLLWIDYTALYEKLFKCVFVQKNVFCLCYKKNLNYHLYFCGIFCLFFHTIT